MAYENVRQVVEQYNVSKKQFEQHMKNAFTDIFATFFRDYPEIKAIVWNQYTPYFNDGDPCVFGVGDFEHVDTVSDIDLSGIRCSYEIEDTVSMYKEPSNWMRKEPEYADVIERYDQNKDLPRFKEVVAALNELKSVLSSIPNEVFLHAFGDHAVVSATAEGIDVREFDHD